MTVLHLAASAGHDQVLIALLDAGAAIDASLDGKNYNPEFRNYSTGTALYLAAKQGHARTAQLLLERKALVNGLYQVFVLIQTWFFAALNELTLAVAVFRTTERVTE